MISHEQNTIHGTEEQTPPLLVPKPPFTSASSWRRPSSWRGWSLWLRVVGVVLSVVSGFVFFDFLMLRTDIMSTPMSIIWLLLPGLLGAVSAALFRSSWAVLIVPVALIVGVNLSLLTIFVEPSMALSLYEGVGMASFFLVWPVAIGAAIGTPIGQAIERRLQH